MIRTTSLILPFVLLACSACNKDTKPASAAGPSAAAPSAAVTATVPAAAFVLTCAPLDTADSGTIVCFRMDTRSGEILRIRQDRLPQSAASTKSAAQAAGTYQLECASSSTDKKANMSCIRLNRATGDMMLISLPKLSEFPDK